jgi:hypothetical protein
MQMHEKAKYHSDHHKSTVIIISAPSINDASIRKLVKVPHEK